VAGEPSDTRIDGAIRALTGDDQRLTYIPGFLNEQAFWEVLANVEWVVLPYEQIVSSGVLVAALQMSRRILSPTPIGGLPLYGHASGSPDWVTVDPWDDETAIARWLTAADLQRPGSPTTLNLPTWDAAAETMTAFYRELVSSRPENERRSHSAGPPSPNPTPVFAPLTAGDPFDFGTHSNDFLLRREQALATETFLVRVPGLGAVPEHVHTDMEQTFVFVSGVGEATLSRDDGPVIRRTCVPGDMVFVPTGWRHSVTALTLEGVAYVTVNAFVPGADRIGDSAVSHASIALTGFEASRPPAPSPSDAPETASALALFRTAETAFLADDDLQRARAQDFTALQATLTREPSTYRVRRTGPFEYVRTVTARPRVLTAALADVLFGAVAGRAPVYVEGSQSPISAKLPCSESDVDVLLAVDSAEQLIAAHEALNALKRVAGRLPAPLSPGVVHIDWLRLPNFYTALSLDPASPDRRWWDATESERLEEADRRLRRSLTQLDDVAELRDLLGRSLALAGLTDVAVDEWRLIPRWRGYV
jgi:quercetin dioxygenase-like cupin family protein